MTAKEHGSLLLWIKLIVFLDFFGVALVVPLLTSYFRDAGISTKLLGFLSSLYSISQIFGGLVIGVMSDSCSKRDVLLLSLLGTAISYFIVGTSKSIPMLFFSRILVGLVKQTYTIATTVINETTDGHPELRSSELGRLSAISTVSFIVGPSLGSILYAYSKDAPAKAAALCFVLNAAICVLFVPQTGIMASTNNKIKNGIQDIPDENNENKKDKKKNSALYRFFAQPYNIFRGQLIELAMIPNVLVVILIRIAIMFVESSMSSRNIVSYYETRFGIPTSALGFMATATSVIGMVIQTVLLNPILKFFGGNSSMVYFAITAMAVCNLLEGLAPSYLFFVICSQIPNVIASSLLSASVRNIFANTIPSQHMGKSLGVFSMMISGVGIISPLYASQVFSAIPGEKYKGYVACVHFIGLVMLVGHLTPHPTLIGTTEKEGLKRDEKDKVEKVEKEEGEKVKGEKEEGKESRIVNNEKKVK